MKFATICLLAFGSAVAQKTTSNDCFNEEGASKKEDCSSLFYNMCESYVMEADSSCNVFTYSDSQIDWFSSEIYVVNWYFIEKNEAAEAEKAAETAEGFEEEIQFDENGDPIVPEEPEELPCDLDSEIPTQYERGTRMQLFSGLCGFKYQITNTDVNATYTFDVLRDGAVTMAASVSVAVAALALF